MAKAKKTQTDNESRILALRELQQSEGWKLVRAVLLQNIHQIRRELDGAGGEEIKTLAEMKAKQDQIADRKGFVLLPDWIIGDLTTHPEKEPRLDPYDTQEDIEAEMAVEAEDLNPPEKPEEKK